MSTAKELREAADGIETDLATPGWPIAEPMVANAATLMRRAADELDTLGATGISVATSNGDARAAAIRNVRLILEVLEHHPEQLVELKVDETVEEGGTVHVKLSARVQP